MSPDLDLENGVMDYEERREMQIRNIAEKEGISENKAIEKWQEAHDDPVDYGPHDDD